MKISLKLVYQYMAIFFNFSFISSHLYPLQVENCDSNSRLVVNEDDNGKFRLEKVNGNMASNTGKMHLLDIPSSVSIFISFKAQIDKTISSFKYLIK